MRRVFIVDFCLRSANGIVIHQHVGFHDVLEHTHSEILRSFDWHIIAHIRTHINL